jgi:hypothetical protein
VLATQPLKVPVYNRIWLFSYAATSDIYDRWWLVCHAFGLCCKKHFIMAIKKLYEQKYNFTE